MQQSGLVAAPLKKRRRHWWIPREADIEKKQATAMEQHRKRRKKLEVAAADRAHIIERERRFADDMKRRSSKAMQKSNQAFCHTATAIARKNGLQVPGGFLEGMEGESALPSGVDLIAFDSGDDESDLKPSLQSGVTATGGNGASASRICR